LDTLQRRGVSFYFEINKKLNFITVEEKDGKVSRTDN